MGERLEEREAGLRRELSVRLLWMIAIGQSIGTGLFLGSGIAVQMAGPGVIFSFLLGAALFGGIFCWIMIFVTHLRFRRNSWAPSSLLGLLLLLAVLFTMGFVPEMRASWIAGVPWLLAISLAYKVACAKAARRPRAGRNAR